MAAYWSNDPAVVCYRPCENCGHVFDGEELDGNELCFECAELDDILGD